MAFESTLKCSNNDDFNSNSTTSQSFHYEHLDDSLPVSGALRKDNDNDEIYSNYYLDERLQWTTDDCKKHRNNQFCEFALVEEKMDSFNLNEPLDLRIRQKI